MRRAGALVYMTLRVLIVEPDPEELLFLQDVLREVEDEHLLPEWEQIEPLYAVTWEEARRIVLTSAPHAILLDSEVEPEAGPAECFRRMQRAALETPVLVLVDASQENLAVQLVRDGVQDFLFKKQIDCVPLAHALRNAVLRHKLLAAARSASLTDSLTRLPDRSAFLTMADRDRKLAERLERRWMLLIAEPRNLEEIALAFGEQRRDMELIEAAEQLRRVITPADWVARISDRHFALSIFDSEVESAEEAWARIRTSAMASRINVGACIFDPNRDSGRDASRPMSLESMLERALADLPPRKSAKLAGAA